MSAQHITITWRGNGWQHLLSVAVDPRRPGTPYKAYGVTSSIWHDLQEELGNAVTFEWDSVTIWVNSGEPWWRAMWLLEMTWAVARGHLLAGGFKHTQLCKRITERKGLNVNMHKWAQRLSNATTYQVRVTDNMGTTVAQSFVPPVQTLPNGLLVDLRTFSWLDVPPGVMAFIQSDLQKWRNQVE